MTKPLIALSLAALVLVGLWALLLAPCETLKKLHVVQVPSRCISDHPAKP